MSVVVFFFPPEVLTNYMRIVKRISFATFSHYLNRGTNTDKFLYLQSLHIFMEHLVCPSVT